MLLSLTQKITPRAFGELLHANLIRAYFLKWKIGSKLRRNSFVGKESFCVVPWISLHVDTEGHRRLCCAADKVPDLDSRRTAKEFINSPYMKKIRQQMMNGTLPEHCRFCAKTNRTDSYKDELNLRFHKKFKKIESNSLPDGEILLQEDIPTGLSPIYLDYRAHACNFTCKTCCPESSSAWLAKLTQQEGQWDGLFTPGASHYIRANLAKAPSKEEFFELVKSSAVEVIYFAGGEPLMAKAHWDIFQYLLDSNRAGKIQLSYNTNLSLPGEKLEAWASKLHRFDLVDVGCSLDGVGEVGEYVRTGLVMDRFAQNLKVLQRFALKEKVKVFLDTTITSAFLSDLRSFSDFALANRVRVSTKLMVTSEGHSGFLRCEFLPKTVRAALIQPWLDYFETLNAEDKSLLQGMKRGLLLALSAEEFTMHSQYLPQIAVQEKNMGDRVSFASFMNRNPASAQWFAEIQPQLV